MQAIATKVLPATNTRPTRIVARCQRGSLTVSWDDPRLDKYHHVEDKHCAVARLLCRKFVEEDVVQYGSDPDTNPWNSDFVCGGLPEGSPYVFACVFLPRK